MPAHPNSLSITDGNHRQQGFDYETSLAPTSVSTALAVRT
jgi:hypothetical protein